MARIKTAAEILAEIGPEEDDTYVSPTQRQADVLAALKAFVAREGRSPTHLELAGEAKIPMGRVGHYVRALRRKGLIAPAADDFHSVRLPDGKRAP